MAQKPRSELALNAVKGVTNQWRTYAGDVLAQFVNVLVQLPLRNPRVLILDDLRHLFIGQANPQILVRIFWAGAIAQLFFAVLHGKQIEVMRIIKAAHAFTSEPSNMPGLPHSDSGSPRLISTSNLPLRS